MTRFDLAMKHVLHWEGGLVDNQNDPGGITNYGISLRWLEEKGLDLNGDGAVNDNDIRGLDAEEASALYRTYFWEKPLDAVMDDNVAVYIFDMAVNMGEDRANRIAQEACGAEVDGKLGPKTVEAINAQDPGDLLERMRDLRSEFYRNLAARKPKLAVFLDGWLKRAAA